MQSNFRIYRSIWILILAFFLTKNISNLVQNYNYLSQSAFHIIQYLTSLFSALFTLLLIIEQFLLLTNKLSFKLNFKFLVCLTGISAIILLLNIFNIGYLTYLVIINTKIAIQVLISFSIDFGFSLLITILLINLCKKYYKSYKLFKNKENNLTDFKNNDSDDNSNNFVN